MHDIIQLHRITFRITALISMYAYYHMIKIKNYFDEVKEIDWKVRKEIIM